MNTPYTPLLKTLVGRPMMVEVADPARPGVEVIKGFFWDLFFDNTIALFVVFEDENVNKPSEVQKQENEDYKNKIAALALNPNLPKPAPPVPVFVEREFHMKWVRVGGIIMVKSDTQVKINRDTRQMTKPKLDPLYTDGKSMWHILNNNVARQVVAKLTEMGLATEGYYYRNEQNETVTRVNAVFAAPAPVLTATPAPVMSPVATVPVGNIPPITAPVPVPVEAPIAAGSPVAPVF